MSNNAVELLLKLKGETKGLKGVNNEIGKIDKGLKNVDKSSNSVNKSLKEIGSSAKGMKSLAAGATATALAIGAIVSKVNNLNVELRRNATLAGTTVENFQAMANIGAKSGVTFEETADALNNLNLKINEANELGSGAGIDVFRKLGLDPAALSKITDSTEQAIIVIDKLKKAPKGIKRLFSDELGSDALIQLAESIGLTEDTLKSIKKELGKDGIISDEESLKLLKINAGMSELTKKIQKVGVQAVLSFEKELTDSLDVASKAMSKLIKDFDDPFGEVNKSIEKLKGGLKVLVNAAGIVASAQKEFVNYISPVDIFDTKLKDVNKNIDGLSDGIESIKNPDLNLGLDQLDELENQLKDFDPAKLLASGKTEEEVKEIFDKLAVEILKQNQVLFTKFSNEKSFMDAFLKKDLNNQVKNELKELQETFSKFNKENKVEIDVGLVVGDVEKTIKNIQAEMGLIELQFKSGTIDLSEYKKKMTEANNFVAEQLNKAINNTTGLDQIGYKKQLEQNKIQLQDIEKQQAIVNSKIEKQRDINAEILQQEIEIARNKGELTKALELERKKELELIELREKSGELNKLDAAVLGVQTNEIYDFKQAEIEADSLKEKIDGLFEKLGSSDGSDRIVLISQIDSILKEMIELKNKEKGVDLDINDVLKQRNELVNANKLTEEEIKQASDEVLNSKIQILKAQGEVEKASKLELERNIENIKANKLYNEEQKNQLINDQQKLAQMKEQTRQSKELEEQIKSLFGTLKNTNNVEEQQKIVNQIIPLLNSISEIESKTAGFQTNYKKLLGDLQLFLEETNKSTVDLSYSQDLLAQKEIELLEIQGKREEVLKRQFEINQKNIQSNDKIDESIKQQILDIEKQKFAYSEARLEVEKLEEKIENVMEQMRTADTVEEYNKLAQSIQPSIDKLNEINEIFPGLKTKAEEFTNEAIEGMGRFKMSIEEAANFYADSFVNSFQSVIDGTMSVEDAFKSMLQNIVAELLKSNISSLLQNIFGSGGSGSGFGDLFTGIAGIFSGTALHTGGIAGQDGFARNFKFDFSNLPKYHTGGIAGLKPNEIPAVLNKGEEVLTENDSRHRNNGGKASGDIKIINEIKSEEAADTLGKTRAFKDAIKNEIMNNQSEYKSILS